MVAGFEGTPHEGTRTRSSGPASVGARATSLAPVGVISGSLTTLEILQGRGTQRPVVRKRLADAWEGDSRARDTLAAVGHLGMRLSAPELVRTLAVKEGADGFIALEYVEGLDLAQLLRVARTPECTSYLVPIMLDVLRALRVLHALHGPEGDDTPVVHQAPVARHIVVGTDGRARLCDLMHVLAPGLPTSPERQRFLRPEEMSPEQASGSGHIDARSDLFAVGVVIWEWLTGERLFAAATPHETLARVMRLPISAPSQHGLHTQAFDALCARALMRVRVGRYGSTDELAADLRTLGPARDEHTLRAEIGAWVQRGLELSARESQTLLRPSPAPPAPPAAHGPAPRERPSSRSGGSLRRTIVEVGVPSSDRAPDPRAERIDDGASGEDSSPTIARSDLLGLDTRALEHRLDARAQEPAAPVTPFDAATRARPGLSEQLAAELRSAENSIEDEPTRAHRPQELAAVRSLFDSERDLPPSDSVQLPRFLTDADRHEPERDDPTKPRLSQPGAPRPSIPAGERRERREHREHTGSPRIISAVFGGPMPSVLGEGARWPDESGASEPRLAQSLEAMDAAPQRARSWFWSALLGALAMAALFGLYVAFGGGGEGHSAPERPAVLEGLGGPSAVPAASTASTDDVQRRAPEPVANTGSPAVAAEPSPAALSESVVPGAGHAVSSARAAARWQARRAAAAARSPSSESTPPAAAAAAPAPVPARAAEVPDNPY